MEYTHPAAVIKEFRSNFMYPQFAALAKSMMKYVAHDRRIEKMWFKEPNILLKDNHLFVELPVIPTQYSQAIQDIFKKAGLEYECDTTSMRGFCRFRIDFMEAKSESLLAATLGIKVLTKESRHTFTHLAGSKPVDSNISPPRPRDFEFLPGGKGR